MYKDYTLFSTELSPIFKFTVFLLPLGTRVDSVQVMMEAQFAQVQRKLRSDKEMRWERAPAVLGRHADERCLAQAFNGIHVARRRHARRPSTVTQCYFRRVLVKLGVCNPKVRWDTRDCCLNARPKLRRTRYTWLIDYVV